MSNFDPAKAKYVSLITYRKTGKEVKTPVWVAPYSGNHYLFSESKAGKIKRLNNNNAVKIALCDIQGKILNPQWLEGRATVVNDAKLIEQVYKSFDNKYGLIMKLTNLMSKLSGRYNQRAIIEIKLD